MSDQPIRLNFEVTDVDPGQTVTVPMVWELCANDRIKLAARREVAARQIVIPAGRSFRVVEARVGGHVVATMFRPCKERQWQAAELVSGKGYEMLRRGGLRDSDGLFTPTTDGPLLGGFELTVTNLLERTATLKGVVLAG